MPSTATSILDGLSTSVAVKAPCRTVATTNITLAGLQTISGYTTVENDRVLVKGQTNAVDNGIYMASTGSWSRAKDADGNRDLVQGTRVLVRSTTINGVEYELTSANPIVIGTTELTFVLRYGANGTYDQTEDEIGAGLTPANTGYPPGHVLRWGTNTVPGTTDMTLAFQRAALTSLEPYAPAGVYLITGSIPLRDNQHWLFDGARITIASSTVQVFTVASGIDDWSIRGSWSVTGDNDSAGSQSGTAAAINIIDSMRFLLEGLVAKNIRGWGIRVSPGAGTALRSERGTISNPQMYGCYIGFEVIIGTSAEYLTIVSPSIARCNTGAIVAAGNCNVVGGTITDCVDCVYIGNGSNHAHGIFNGVQINHATNYSVRCHQVTNGQTFADCHIYEGDIWLDRCKGVTFRGGIMDPTNIYNDFDGSSGYNFMTDNYWPGPYLTLITSTNAGEHELVIMRAEGAGSYLSGIKISDPSPVYVNARRAAGDTQSLTSATPATLIFNAEDFDRRKAYVHTTGIFTVPSGQAGVYRIRANTTFAGTGMSTTASYIEVLIDGSARAMFAPSIFSTTRLSILVDTEIYLNAGQTVQLRGSITGTTPVFGDATYTPNLTIERL